jgi:hypothetical protein
MPKYTVTRNYSSSTLGTYAKGDVVELDEELAAWANRDSPGVLEPYKEKKRAAEKPPEDRQVKSSRKRS